MQSEKGLAVLSLFDGIGCGRVALERANILVDKYYASEIDEYAINVSEKKYPTIIQLGDITKIEFKQFERQIDIIMGGSPCQDLSIAKKDRPGLDGSKSSLFYKFVEAVKIIKPKFFLLENVIMKKEWEEIITEHLGVKPILINSSLVCAAERKRLYWTNIPNIMQPNDKNIYLKDIIEKEVDEKYFYNNKYDYVYNGDDKKVQCTLLIKGHDRMKEVYNINGKSSTILCDGNGGHRVKKVYINERVRRLSPLEYERLQTLPDNYTQGLSDSRRYSLIGNGWTVDVIAHILSFIQKKD